LAASALRVLVRALKRVLLPTLGKPTIPALSIIVKDAQYAGVDAVGQESMHPVRL